jgi:acetate kinase
LTIKKNEACTGESPEIQGEKSPVKILVIPTNEELDIALQTCELILKDL